MRKYGFIACGILLGFSSCSKDDTKKQTTVRYDGLYQAEYTGKDYSGYLRFYEDKTVVGVSSTGTPEQVAVWLTNETKTNMKGSYTAEGDSVFFTLTSSSGSIEYRVHVISDGTDIETHSVSNINGNVSEELYHFVEIK